MTKYLLISILYRDTIHLLHWKYYHSKSNASTLVIVFLENWSTSGTFSILFWCRKWAILVKIAVEWSQYENSRDRSFKVTFFRGNLYQWNVLQNCPQKPSAKEPNQSANFQPIKFSNNFPFFFNQFLIFLN